LLQKSRKRNTSLELETLSNGMASVTSHTSPHSSLYDFDSTGDEEPWQFLDYSSGASAPGSVGFLPSPASGSLNGYAIVGHLRLTPPQASVSPLSLVEMDQTMFLPAGSTFPGQNDRFTNNSIAASSGGPSFFTPQQYLFSGTERELTQQELNGEFERAWPFVRLAERKEKRV
jgi:hypothetical protein